MAAEEPSREEIEEIVNNEPIKEEEPSIIEEVKPIKPKSKAKAKAKIKITKQPVVEEPVVKKSFKKL